MPGYVITLPDGKKYRVNTPEGTTQEQAYEMLRGHLGGDQSTTAKEQKPERAPLLSGEGLLQRGKELVSGIGRGGMGAMQSATEGQFGDELPFLPESAIKARRAAAADLKRQTQAPLESGYDEAGRVIGASVPAALLFRGIGLPAQLARYMPAWLASAIAGSAEGATAASMQPTTGDKSTQAVTGAAMGAVPPLLRSGYNVVRGPLGHLARHGFSYMAANALGHPHWWPVGVPAAWLASKMPSSLLGSLAGQVTSKKGDLSDDNSPDQQPRP